MDAAWKKNKGLEGERKSGIAYFHESKGKERLSYLSTYLH